MIPWPHVSMWLFYWPSCQETMHKTCRAASNWIWMPQKRPQTTSPWKVLQHLIEEFPTNKLHTQSHQLRWMHESTTIYIYTYIYVYGCLQFCAHVHLLSRRAISCWLFEEAMVLCCISPVSWSHFKECLTRFFLKDPILLRTYREPSVFKYLNRFDSGQRVGRHIRMSWWPLYKLSDLHSTAFMDDFCRVVDMCYHMFAYLLHEHLHLFAANTDGVHP